MKVLMHDYGGYPFIYDLSQELAKLEYEVTHIYSSASGSPHGNFKQNERLRVIDLGIDLPRVDKNSFLKRYKQENQYGNLIVQKIKDIKPDLVISSNTPLEAQKKIARACTKDNIRFIHWLQDILSVAAKNVLDKKSYFLAKIVGAYFERIERECLHSADHVISITDGFSHILRNWGIADKKISIIENWSNVVEIPVVPKRNPFSTEFNLQDTFNLVYSGTLGMKQNPDALLEIAKLYKTNPHFRLVVVATGSGVNYLSEHVKRLGLKNVLIMPLRPFSELPNVLGSSDILMAILEDNASEYCVPSKVLTYYCAGRPSLLILSKKNLAAQNTLQHNLGFVIEPGDWEQLKKVVDASIDNPDLLSQYGSNARAYAESHFDPERIVQQFLPIIKKFTT